MLNQLELSFELQAHHLDKKNIKSSESEDALN